MPNVELALRIEQFGISTLAGKCTDRKRRHEMLRGRREDTPHACSPLAQAANEIERFVSRNTAADNQKDALRFSRVRWLNLPRGARRRLKRLERVPARILRRLRQDGANLIFHGAAVARRAQPQQPLEPVIKLPDGEARHPGSSRSFRILAGK